MSPSLLTSRAALPLHRSRVTVDLGGLRENVRAVLRSLPKGAGLLPVIKSNAYGHGIIPVSQIMTGEGIPRVAVMGADEGCLLRESGFSGQIILLGGFVPEEIPLCHNLRLTPVIHHIDQVWALERCSPGDTPLNVHLKIDSGMGRLGFLPQDLPLVLDRLQKVPSVRIEGLMTHFPVPEDREDTSDCREIFRQAIIPSMDHPALSDLSVVHMASSGAILSGEVMFDLPVPPSGRRITFWARPGILLYGHFPGTRNPSLPVRPVFGLEARILAIRTLPRGSSISYGRTVRVDRESRIGILGMGYADGLPRLLSGKGWAVIGKHCAPFLGRICMDMVVVDLTDIPTDELHSEWITLIDPANPLSMSVDQLALEGDTIPYEILCLLGHRSERRYVGIPLSDSGQSV
ncbi:MAG: alanine racemase [Leptospirillia bacterium]